MRRPSWRGLRPRGRAGGATLGDARCLVTDSGDERQGRTAAGWNGGAGGGMCVWQEVVMRAVGCRELTLVRRCHVEGETRDMCGREAPGAQTHVAGPNQKTYQITRVQPRGRPCVCLIRLPPKCQRHAVNPVSRSRPCSSSIAPLSPNRVRRTSADTAHPWRYAAPCRAEWTVAVYVEPFSLRRRRGI